MLVGVIDDFAKAYLHDNLRWARESLLFKLDGLSEYDVRRPLTRTGTNLLGLVKHLGLSESRYLGEIVGRPFPEPLPRFDDPDYANHDHMWVTEQESRADVIDGYHRACRHADATIEALQIDAPGFVPWCPTGCRARRRRLASGRPGSRRQPGPGGPPSRAPAPGT